MFRNLSVLPRRFISLQEYQSKALMASYGVRVQHGSAVSNATEAAKVSADLAKTAPELVIKAQILAGGRGKGTFTDGFKGGVHLSKSATGAADLAKRMLNNTLVTQQTGPNGALVSKVLICEAVNIKHEAYFAILLDRTAQGTVLVGSPAGGMDIEHVAATTPEKVFTEVVDFRKGVTDEQANRMAERIGFGGNKELRDRAAVQIKSLYKLFLARDATMVEVNPLALTDTNEVVCVDAKMQFDDNASFRQKDLFSMHNPEQDDPREARAQAAGLNYVALDGNIGCLVNGAGLAMATMDVIALHGGKPANFLDVGGSASTEQVAEAFSILTSDKSVKAILVNVFGGIMRCDVIAQGVVEAARKLKLTVPLVVRLEGTNVELGKKILRDSGLRIVAADDLDDAAKKAVLSTKD
ncbi:mitochondrial succinyl-CoA synthetase beta subunit (GDP) [Andalucia godoyi]|uniref:Succinate--CoA ligase [ADP-forming] subunit beta, mitochondrial n=1 Tax=Andalucia godoyi TaxID=505711 RepID=A0A8K0AJG2_ANDGO|nr:mitochondrial succinyl-CoA synthetase beta subunit (GDP) [Andalucia godoyi]|eukprot:ANDGO_01142.mRNA.1 mitochondrial succinyl-CoA synthetase beta subunit (GDP)